MPIIFLPLILVFFLHGCAPLNPEPVQPSLESIHQQYYLEDLAECQNGRNFVIEPKDINRFTLFLSGEGSNNFRLHYTHFGGTEFGATVVGNGGSFNSKGAKRDWVEIKRGHAVGRIVIKAILPGISTGICDDYEEWGFFNPDKKYQKLNP